MNTYMVYRADADNYDRDIEVEVEASSVATDGAFNLSLRDADNQLVAYFPYGYWAGWRLVHKEPSEDRSIHPFIDNPATKP